MSDDAATAVTWRRYMFTEFKVHAVTLTLEQPLLAEMTARGATLADYSNHGLANPKTIAELSFDLGGAAYEGRPHEEFSWSGIRLWVPSEDMDGVMSRLAALTVRRFATGEPYLKLHHWHCCTVMTPTQAEELRVLLDRRLETARERAVLFSEAVDRAIAHGGVS